jgi:hypothetical protein
MRMHAVTTSGEMYNVNWQGNTRIWAIMSSKPQHTKKKPPEPRILYFTVSVSTGNREEARQKLMRVLKEEQK